MTYLFPGLLAIGLPLVLLPVLIHLINMMRHRRIPWAAMEFLLASQKKNRRWVILKQLLLLLLRMGAVAAVVFMVAQPQLRNQLGNWFGGSKIHHVVLIDDSFSMSDRWADTSAFDEAKKRVLAIARQIEQQQAMQEFTLLRFSKAARSGRGMQPDLRASVDSEFRAKLEQKLDELKVSELAAGPGEALDSALQLVDDGREQGEQCEIYLITDFRKKEWNEAGDLRKRLQELNENGIEPKLIACVDGARPNLAISNLKPLPGTRAAGVNLVMEVTVQNYGSEKARDVSILLEEDGKARPAETIEELGPGQSQSRTFEVKFTTPGEHRIVARLQSDAVEADNARYSVLDFQPSVPVLLIEGDPRDIASKESDSYYLSQALSPEVVLTGVKPQIEPQEYLRNKPLSGFHAIYLMNVSRLQESEVTALEEYCKSGGGVAFFVGDRTMPEVYNATLYRNGEGLFPVPLVKPVLLEAPIEQGPDLELSVHPVFGKFAGDRNPFIAAVNVTRYIAVEKSWKPPEGSTAKVIARLRNGAPLAVERSFGEGRVIAFLTTAGPGWNNWARANPSYIVTMQQLQAHLSAWKQSDPARQLGTPLKIDIAGANFVPEIGFVTPLEGSLGMFSAKATQADDHLTYTLDNTEKSGIYEARLTTNDGRVEIQQYAYNVVPTEGELAIVDERQLADRLSEVAYQFHRAGDLAFGAKEFGQNLSESILYLLVAMLLGEQLLAYSASYHPQRREVAS